VRYTLPTVQALRARSEIVSPLGALLGGAYAALLAFRPLRDPDLFWHLAVGRYVAEHHALPTRNLWSYTAPDQPFLASSWLFDLVLHGLERAGGFVLLQAVLALVVGATFAVLFLASRRRGASPAVALAICLALATASEARFTPRPQVVTYLFLALTVLLLGRPAEAPRPRVIALLALILAVWANMHAGVVFGLGVVGCCVVGAMFENRSAGWAGLAAPPSRRWLITGACCLLAAMVTPHTTGLLRYATFHLGEVNRVVELGEFATPTLRDSPIFWILLVLAPLLFFGARRRLGPGDWVALVAFGVLAARAVRVVVEFFLVVGPPFALALAVQFERLSAAPRLRRVPWVLPPAALAASLALAPFPWWHVFLRPRPGVDPWYVPMAALARARDWGIAGRCFAGWDVSGLVEWGAPEDKVQIDPRLLAYPPEVFHELGEAERSPEAFDALVRRHDIEWAFRSQRFMRYVGAGMFLPDRWAIVYWDESGLVLLRRDVPRFQSLIAAHEYHELLPSSPVLEQWTNLRGPARERWVEEAHRLAATSPRLVTPRVALALDALGSGRLDESRTLLNQAAGSARELSRLHPQPDGSVSTVTSIAFTLLAKALVSSGRLDEADGASREAVALAPRSADTWTGLGYAWMGANAARATEAFHTALRFRAGHPSAQAGLERLQGNSGR